MQPSAIKSPLPGNLPQAQNQPARDPHLSPAPPNNVLENLRQRLARLEKLYNRTGNKIVSTGCAALDRVLPGGGFPCGSLVEFLASDDGSGTVELALRAARQACQDGKPLVVIDRPGQFYPPAAVCIGIQPRQLLVVQPHSQADEHWAIDQAMRCPAVGAVLAWPGTIDQRTFRRLQLAAEHGGGLGLLIRPLSARREPSWAQVRLVVEPLPGGTSRKRRLRIELLRCRGTADKRTLEVKLGQEAEDGDWQT